MNKESKIYVAGHRGMVGSAIVRELTRQGYTNIITRTHAELDLCRQDAVEAFFASEKPEYVFLAAAKVGGIVANQSALADFMYDNMILEMNVIHSAWQNGCKKLLFLGSSCIYPRLAPQPMTESCLLTGELEKTNEAYALAKISGLKYCEFLNRQYGTDYISVMPTNLSPDNKFAGRNDYRAYKTVNGELESQPENPHTDAYEQQKDINGKYVLLSEHFVYWGEACGESGTEIRALYPAIYKGDGTKSGIENHSRGYLVDRNFIFDIEADLGGFDWFPSNGGCNIISAKAISGEYVYIEENDEEDEHEVCLSCGGKK